MFGSNAGLVDQMQVIDGTATETGTINNNYGNLNISEHINDHIHDHINDHIHDHVNDHINEPINDRNNDYSSDDLGLK